MLESLAKQWDRLSHNKAIAISAQIAHGEDARALRALIRAEEERASGKINLDKGIKDGSIVVGEHWRKMNRKAEEERGKAEAGEWRGDWICESCGTVLPNDKGRDYDFSTKTHLTAESGSYMGHKVCNGKLVPHERRADERRTYPTPDAGLPRYPVELRCAELEEKMKALNGYLRHHDTCLKAMRFKNTGFDDTAPCDCGLDAALASAPSEGVRE
jgi:hypothetical protein